MDSYLLRPALAISLCATLATAQQSLITNGSFEQGPAIPTGSWLTVQPGTGQLPGWTVIQSSIDICNLYWETPDGTRSLDLDGHPGNGGVEQTFATTPNERYLVAFRMAGNPVGGPAVKLMEVSAAGTAATFSFDITGHTTTDMGWEDHTWVFVATDATTTLRFLSLSPTPNYCGPTLDDVRVWPDSFAAYGAGCAGTLPAAPSLAEAAGSLPRIGSNYRVEIHGVPTSAATLMMVGLRRAAPLDLTTIGAPSCVVEVLGLGAFGPLPNPAGIAMWTVSIPNGPSLDGVPIDVQAVVVRAGLNALGLVVSDAGRFVIR